MRAGGGIGEAIALGMAEAGADVVISDLRTRVQLQASIDSLNGLGIDYVLGEHPMSLLEGTDILAISGGVPADIPLVKAAQAVGIAISIVAMPNTALIKALCPIVKKWCSQTVKDSTAIHIVAITSEL